MNKKEVKERLRKIQAGRDKHTGKKVFTKGMVIDFGRKWRGHRVDEVLELDANWLKWCADEGMVLFDDELYRDIEYQAEVQREDENGRFN